MHAELGRRADDFSWRERGLLECWTFRGKVVGQADPSRLVPRCPLVFLPGGVATRWCIKTELRGLLTFSGFLLPLHHEQRPFIYVAAE